MVTVSTKNNKIVADIIYIMDIALVSFIYYNKNMVSDLLFNITVRIESGNSLGTGFILMDSSNKLFIITNKHVINDVNNTFITIRTTLSRNQRVRVSCKNIKNHPDDTVDLCAIPFHPEIGFVYNSLPISAVQNDNDMSKFQGIEELTVIGYPHGLYDKINNQPIARRGINATNMKINYEGRKEFLLDMPIFEGASGSPVLVYNPMGFFDENEIFCMGQWRLNLVGVVYGSYKKEEKKELEKIDGDSQNTYSLTVEKYLNIGICIKSCRIFDILD